MPQQDRYKELHRELDAERFIEIAKEKTGLSDFGGDGFREPLCKLLDCAARDVDFHAQGLQVFKNDIVRCLVNRLRMRHDLKQHPEILDEDVSDPIVILGLGRSGTTKLQKMLSAPDSVQKALMWRMYNVARFPEAVPGKPDPRIAAANFSELVAEATPDMDAAHHIEQGEVEEVWMLYFYTFGDWIWNQTTPMPSYFDWVMKRPSLETFRDVKTMLQYMQWQDGGRGGRGDKSGGDRPWILKSVGDIANMDSLLECYPNATLVHTHRDPRDTIPSYAKYVSVVWPVVSNPVDPHIVGKEMLREWITAMDRYLEARDRLKLDGRILDVKYEQVRNDPMSIIREIYRRAGRNLSAAAERKMADWHDSNEQYRFGKHEYSLGELGLSEASIDKAFGEYIKRFIER